MIRPTRLSIAPGGEHLLPVAKHALLMLRTQMERLKVPTLSQILNVGEGRIEIVANAFGIDSINISWKSILPHGFVCRPESHDAKRGWGKPFKADDGTAINPPLGTVLTGEPFDGDTKQREILFYRNNYNPPPTIPPDEKVLRRFTKSGSLVKYTGNKLKWFSKDKKIVLTAGGFANGFYVYSRGIAIASANWNTDDDIDVFKAIGVFTGKDDDGKDKKYLWAITAKTDVTETYHVLKFYRTPFKDRKLEENTRTDWELLGSVDIEEELQKLGVENPQISIGRVVINESCSQAMCVYKGTSGVHSDHQVTGYVVFEREPFDVSVKQNNNSARVTTIKRGSDYSWVSFLEDVPDEFVFDVGYRGDRQVFAKVDHISFLFDFEQTDNATVPSSTRKLSAQRKMVVSFDGEKFTVDDSKLDGVHAPTGDISNPGDVRKYIINETFRSTRRTIIEAKPSDGFVFYVDSTSKEGAAAAELTDTILPENPDGYQISSVGYREDTNSGATIKTFVKMNDTLIDINLPMNIEDDGNNGRTEINTKFDRTLCSLDLPPTENTANWENTWNQIRGTDCSESFDYYYSLGSPRSFINPAAFGDDLNLQTISVFSAPYGGLGDSPYTIPFPNYLYRKQSDSYQTNHEHIPIDDESGFDAFSIMVNDEFKGNSNEGYTALPRVIKNSLFGFYEEISDFEETSTIRWINYLTDNDPVELSEVTGLRPRFNDITVF